MGIAPRLQMSVERRRAHGRRASSDGASFRGQGGERRVQPPTSGHTPAHAWLRACRKSSVRRRNGRKAVAAPPPLTSSPLRVNATATFDQLSGPPRGWRATQPTVLPRRCVVSVLRVVARPIRGPVDVELLARSVPRAVIRGPLVPPWYLAAFARFRRETAKARISGTFLNSGGGIRTRDLRVIRRIRARGRARSR